MPTTATPVVGMTVHTTRTSTRTNTNTNANAKMLNVGDGIKMNIACAYYCCHYRHRCSDWIADLNPEREGSVVLRDSSPCKETRGEGSRVIELKLSG